MSAQDKFGVRWTKSTKPTRKLEDMEEALTGIDLPEGEWRFGALRLNDGKEWCVILQIDSCEFDLILPGVYATEEEAINIMLRLSKDTGGIPIVPGGEA